MDNIEINPVSIILVLPVLYILVSSLFTPFSRDRIAKGIYSIFNNLEFIFSLLLSLYLTKGIFVDKDKAVFVYIYNILPSSIKNMMAVNNIYSYICAVFVIMLIVVILFRLITYPLFSYALDGLSEGIFRVMNRLGNFSRRVISFICSIPRAVVTLLLVSFIFYFFTYYVTMPGLTKWSDDSRVLNAVYASALKPVLNSEFAKKLPVILNDQFNTQDSEPTDEQKEIENNIRQSLKKYNIKVIQYFNGVTLDEAIKSTPQIDNLARSLTKGETTDYKKAKKLYNWITSNIAYDYPKAQLIARSTKNTKSGTIICYETKKGICFDYSSLFVSMCKANGIKVRLVTGLGYSGLAWGDHAWNQFYSTEQKRWVDVDSTFGVTQNYFDVSKFSRDHKNAEVQGEW